MTEAELPAERPASSSAGPPALELQTFLEARSLAALREAYAAAGHDFADERDFTRQAQRDFFRLAREACKVAPAAPAALEPVRVACGARSFAVYGVIHGMIGGASKEYKAFVNACTRQLPLIGFENGLKMFYPAQRAFTIPDYVAMGVCGSLVTGLQVGFLFPLLLFESLREVFKLGGGDDDEDWDPVDYTPAYHALDPELRRGVEPDPPLPSRLQIEYELGRWNGGLRAAWENPSAIVPRSMFMAGYALGYAEREGLEALDLVVGDLHTMEIVRFLEGELPTHPLFAKGRAMGARSSARRRLDLWTSKVRHLGLAGGLGGLILVSMVLLIYNALMVAGVV
ncbi:MAG: hypothetical protein KDD82_07880 [Planctomycetes bacterium]|nr:hypothetical protein [Planctomycetota bacterium]